MIAMPGPGFLRPWIGSLVYGGAALGVVGLVSIGWLLFGRGPRRRRAYQRAQRLLREQNWQGAQIEVRKLQGLSRKSATWLERAAILEAQALRLAGSMAWKETRYEAALEHNLAAARLLKEDEAPIRERLIQDLLAEVRRLFASRSANDAKAILPLIARVQAIQAPHGEASFWEGLCRVREGQVELALEALRVSCQTEPQVLDSTLYLGALLLREGHPSEALRYLADANRHFPDCPFVTWNLGMAIAANGGDSLAVRALQRALGPRGLSRWVKAPGQAWVEGMPGPERSYVVRLASKFPFHCPVMSQDLGAMIRRGEIALAQVQYKLGNFQEAANLYANVLQNSPPSIPVLRGLGLALARLEHYDQAFKHLRLAHEGNPNDPLTTGFLALCGARGKPLRPDDKFRNLEWAIRLLGQISSIPADVEWAGIWNAVFAEARAAGLPLALEDQVRLANLLASVDATDTAAAAAYDQLAMADLSTVRPKLAWLFCRAVVHAATSFAQGAKPGTPPAHQGLHTDQELILFAMAFQEEGAAREFFAQKQWDFEEVELGYLERCAAHQPGRFPEPFALGMPPRGEVFLLEQSHLQEKAGRSDSASTCIEILFRLDPENLRGHDRRAQLAYRRGDLNRAATFLIQWSTLDPTNPLPLARQAIIETQRGNTSASTVAIDRALKLTNGPQRTGIAFLGGRLALAQWKGKEGGEALLRAQQLFQDCLRENPNHGEALWCLAAVRSLLKDLDGLATMAPAMEKLSDQYPRFQYLAAVCQLAKQNYPQVIQASGRAKTEESLRVEAVFLSGWARFEMGEHEAAAEELQQVVRHNPASPSVDQAYALLGVIHFKKEAYEKAVDQWKAIEPTKRQAWGFERSLRDVIYLAGLRFLDEGNFAAAVNQLAEAERLGASCLTFLNWARVQTARDWLFSQPKDASGIPVAQPLAHFQQAGKMLRQVLQDGGPDDTVAYLLALACKRQGEWQEARNALGMITAPDANVFFQQGWLSLQDNALGQAEQEFDRAWQLDLTSYEACFNLLLVRLAQGQIEPASQLIPWAIELAPDKQDQRLLAILRDLLRVSLMTNCSNIFIPALEEMAIMEEQRLLKLVRGLDHRETVDRLLKTLVTSRSTSAPVREAYLEEALIQATRRLERCQWSEAAKLLAPLTQEKVVVHPTHAALLNLAGCCACLTQDFGGATQHFEAALRLAGNDPRIHHNLALTFELQGCLDEAEPHWNRYLAQLDGQLPMPPNQPDYVERLTFECLSHLGNKQSDKELWTKALDYFQRAQQLRPDDVDLLEKLFPIFLHLDRQDEARRTLRRIQRLRPNEPQYEMYELDLIKITNLNNVERLLEEYDRIIKKYPQNFRLEERAAGVFKTAIAFLTKLSQQLTDQVTKTSSQLRRLPNYEIDWIEVEDYLAKLRSRFQNLRETAELCFSLVSNEAQRRNLRDLNSQITRQIERCRSLVRDKK